MRRTGWALALVLAGLTGVGCQDFRSFWRQSSLEQDVAAMRDPVFADERRVGITGLQRRDELTDDAYQAELAKIARTDKSAAVRAQAVRAINQGREETATPVFMALLTDAEPKVRLEAAKALRNLPDDRAIPLLTGLANDMSQNRDVRIWSVAALGSYRRLDVARALVPLLEARDFAVAYQARMSLHRQTGRDYHFEQGTWLKYLTGRPDPFRAVPATRTSE